MEDMEDEEDVVFEGSTLHQHLIATGYTDFEPSHLSTHPTDTLLNDDTNSPKKQDSHWGKRLVAAVEEKWKSILPAVTGDWLLESVVSSGLTECVLGCGLVSEEDRLLLDHFLPHNHHNYHSPSNHNYHYLHSSWVWWMWSHLLSMANGHRLMLGCVGVAAMVVVVAAVVVLRDIWWWCWWSLPSALLLAVPFSLIVVYMYAFLRSWCLVRQMGRAVVLFRDFSHVMSRCLRLLQEVDLIAKGFVLAQGSSHTRFSASEHDTPQCSSLRATLTHTLRAVVGILVSTHHTLNPHTLQYPCSRHVCEDMPEVDEDCTPTERLLFLKKWVAITRIQLSTVLTELLLVARQDSGPQRLHNARNHLFFVHQAQTIHTHTQALRRHYEYAKSFWFGGERESAGDRERENEGRREGKNKTSFEERKKDVYIAVHSLSLHMQAALYRVHSLENMFDGDNTLADCSDADRNPNNRPENLPSYEFVREQMEVIKRELDSCHGCLEEAEIRMDRRYGRNIDTPNLEHRDTDNVKMNSSENITQTSDISRPVVVVSAMEDPVIEDEVFEVYIDHEYGNHSEDGYDDEFWNTDAKRERQMLRQQKEQGRRVLRELQPILVNRRKMWERREMTALTRQRKDQPKPPSGNQTLGGDENKDPDGRTTQVAGGSDEPLTVSTDDGHSPDTHPEAMNNMDTSHTSVPHKLQNCQCVKEEEEVDSDEERLEAYRRLRRELEEDERRRREEEEEEDEEEERFRLSLPLFGLKRERVEEEKRRDKEKEGERRQHKEQEEEEEEEESIFRLPFSELRRKRRQKEDEEEGGSRRVKVEEEDKEERFRLPLFGVERMREENEEEEERRRQREEEEEEQEGKIRLSLFGLMNERRKQNEEVERGRRERKEIVEDEEEGGKMEEEEDSIRLPYSELRRRRQREEEEEGKGSEVEDEEEGKRKREEEDKESEEERNFRLPFSGLRRRRREKTDNEERERINNNTDIPGMEHSKCKQNSVTNKKNDGIHEETFTYGDNNNDELNSSSKNRDLQPVQELMLLCNDNCYKLGATLNNNFVLENELVLQARGEVFVRSDHSNNVSIGSGNDKLEREVLQPMKEETFEHNANNEPNSLKNNKPENEPTKEEIFVHNSNDFNTPSHYDSESKPQHPTKEETFIHNADIDDDETREVDWTTFRLPSRLSDSLEGRMGLYSGGEGIGFHAQVAAQAIVASRKFTLVEEMFDGIGEGDDDEESGGDEESADEENLK